MTLKMRLPGPPLPRLWGPKKVSANKQPERVLAGRNRKPIAEVAVALGQEEFRIVGAGDNLAIGNLPAAVVVAVQFPQIARVVGEVGVSGEDPDGQWPAGVVGDDLDRVQPGAGKDGPEVERQETVHGRDIRKCTNVGGVRASRVGGDIEGGQQRLAVQEDIEDPPILDAIAEFRRKEDDFGEIQLQVVLSRRERDAVRKIPESETAEIQLVRRPADGANGNSHLLTAELPVVLFAANEVPVAGPFDAEAVHRSLGGGARENADGRGVPAARGGSRSGAEVRAGAEGARRLARSPEQHRGTTAAASRTEAAIHRGERALVPSALAVSAAAVDVGACGSNSGW